MLFPKAPETEIEITKIIGYNYKANVRALGGDLISCFGNDDASPGQTWSAELAKESGPHLCPQTISWRGAEGAEDTEAARPSSLWLGGLWVRDVAESRVSVSSAGVPAPSGIMSYLKQSCPLKHNNITVNSLRRRKTKFHSISPEGRVWESVACTREQGSAFSVGRDGPVGPPRQLRPCVLWVLSSRATQAQLRPASLTLARSGLACRRRMRATAPYPL